MHARHRFPPPPSEGPATGLTGSSSDTSLLRAAANSPLRCATLRFRNVATGAITSLLLLNSPPGAFVRSIVFRPLAFAQSPPPSPRRYRLSRRPGAICSNEGNFYSAQDSRLPRENARTHGKLPAEKTHARVKRHLRLFHACRMTQAPKARRLPHHLGNACPHARIQPRPRPISPSRTYHALSRSLALSLSRCFSLSLSLSLSFSLSLET